MKIKNMASDELIEALIYMAKVPWTDNCFSGFNFDSEEWSDKFKELIDEVVKRNQDREE
jgi:hypothetical protein